MPGLLHVRQQRLDRAESDPAGVLELGRVQRAHRAEHARAEGHTRARSGAGAGDERRDRAEARHLLRELHGLDRRRARGDRADRRASCERIERDRRPRAAAGRARPHALAGLRRRLRLRLDGRSARRAASDRVRHAGRARAPRSRLLPPRRLRRAVDADAVPGEHRADVRARRRFGRTSRRRERRACSTLETALAKAQLSRVALRDPTRATIITVAEAEP